MTPDSRDPLDPLLDAGLLDADEFKDHVPGSAPDAGAAEIHNVQAGQLAVQLGLVTPQQYVECLKEARSGGGDPSLTIEACFLRRGMLDQAGLERLATELSGRPVKMAGKYAVLEKVGEGGLAEVYRGYDHELRRVVALKFVRGASASDIERMRREAQIMAQLHHPGIAQVHDFFVLEGEPCIVMQYIDGPTLADAGLPRRSILEVMAKVCDAVEFAHQQKVIHRDLKPQNIMVDPKSTGGPRPYVMDFGLAKTIEIEGKFSITGSVMGTPHYMPPEQAAGLRDQIDARSDTYALGATLFHLITGRAVFEATNFGEILRRVLEEEPPMPRSIDATISRDLESILLKSLSKEKEHRYATAAALGEDLTRLLHAEPVLATRLAWPTVVLRKLRRSRATLAVVPAALVLILFGAFYALSLGRVESRLKVDRAAAAAACASAEEIRARASQMLYKDEFSLEAYRGLLLQSISACDDAIRLAPTADYRVARGRALEMLGRDREAEEEFKESVAADPESVPGHRALGRLYLKRFREESLKFTGKTGGSLAIAGVDATSFLEAAKSEFAKAGTGRRVAERDEADGLAMELAFAEGRSDEALKRCEALIARSVDVERGWLLHGQIVWLKNDFAAAEADLRRAIANQKWSPEANFYLGYLLFSLGRHDEAIRLESRVLAVHEQAFFALMLRAISRLQSDDAPGALADAETLLRRHPDQWQSHYARALIRFRARDKRCLDDLAAGLKCSPGNVTLLHQRAVMLLNFQGNPEAALPDIKAALAISPGNVDLLTALAQVRYDLGQWQEGLDVLGKALAASPGHAGALQLRGQTLIKMGRLDEAEADIRKAFEARPGDWMVLTAAAALANARQDPVATAEWYRRAVELYPSEIMSRVKYSEALQALGRLDAAREQLEAIRKVAPDDLDVRIAFGQFLHKRGTTEQTVDLDEARAVVADLAKVVAESADAFQKARALTTRAAIEIQFLREFKQARLDAEAAMKLHPAVADICRIIIESARQLAPEDPGY